MDEVSKLLYLEEACVDEAKALLGNWDAVNYEPACNYEQAWSLLLDEYDNKYHNVHGVFKTLFRTKRLETNDAKALREMYYTFNNCTRQTATMVSPTEARDQLFINIALRKLTPALRNAWERKRCKTPQTLPRMEDFTEFLAMKAKAETTFGESSSGYTKQGTTDNHKSHRYHPYDNKYSKQNGKSFKDNKKGHSSNIVINDNKCLIKNCTQNHPIFLCDEFKRMKYDDKLLLVREHNLCRCCLKPGHIARTCGYIGCKDCPGVTIKHHFRICPKIVNKQANKQLATEAPNTSQN